MGEEQSTEKTAVKAAEHEEKVTKREQPADKTGQGGAEAPGRSSYAWQWTHHCSAGRTPGRGQL
jgi:hypothetical protein